MVVRKMKDKNNKKKLNEKGAMFGLDARIALAIFASVSIIVGVALYNVVKRVRATAFISELREIGKAWEQYYLDTGKDLPECNTPPQGTRATKELVKSDVKGWKGPYLNYKEAYYMAPVLGHGKYGDIHLISARDIEWGNNVNWKSVARCNEGDKCYVWVHIHKVSDDLKGEIDNIIDNGDGPSNGNFRWLQLNDGGDDRIYLKYAPFKNPPVL